MVPVDYQFNKRDIRVERMSLDLTTDEGQSCLMKLLTELKPAAIHVALPCGTGSRARERPIASHLFAKGLLNQNPSEMQITSLGCQVLVLETVIE